jgi:hypothetical protein
VVPFKTSKVRAAMTSACFAMMLDLSAASAPRAVMSWVPLIKAMPSLAFKSRGSNPLLSRMYLASPHPVSGHHIFPSPIIPGEGRSTENRWTSPTFEMTTEGLQQWEQFGSCDQASAMVRQTMLRNNITN